MTPVNFKGSNIIMKAPDGAENVVDVHAFKNSESCVTAWAFTAGEVEEITKTGRIYVAVFFGGGMPPVFIGSESEVRAMTVDYGGTFPKQDEDQR